jgi:sugar (pentulose or hexulose) kinase
MTTTSQRYEPTAEGVATYEHLYQTYRTIYPALKTVFAAAAQNGSADER